MWPGSNLGNAIRGPFKSVVASLYCSGLEYPGFFSPQKPKTHTLCTFQFNVRITLIQQHITQRPQVSKWAKKKYISFSATSCRSLKEVKVFFESTQSITDSVPSQGYLLNLNEQTKTQTVPSSAVVKFVANVGTPSLMVKAKTMTVQEVQVFNPLRSKLTVSSFTLRFFRPSLVPFALRTILVQLLVGEFVCLYRTLYPLSLPLIKYLCTGFHCRVAADVADCSTVRFLGGSLGATS